MPDDIIHVMKPHNKKYMISVNKKFIWNTKVSLFHKSNKLQTVYVRVIRERIRYCFWQFNTKWKSRAKIIFLLKTELTALIKKLAWSSKETKDKQNTWRKRQYLQARRRAQTGHLTKTKILQKSIYTPDTDIQSSKIYQKCTVY